MLLNINELIYPSLLRPKQNIYCPESSYTLSLSLVPRPINLWVWYALFAEVRFLFWLLLLLLFLGITVSAGNAITPSKVQQDFKGKMFHILIIFKYTIWFRVSLIWHLMNNESVFAHTIITQYSLTLWIRIFACVTEGSCVSFSDEIHDSSHKPTKSKCYQINKKIWWRYL